MKITSQANALQVQDVTELNAASSLAFREQVRAAIKPEHKLLDVDFSATRFIDSSGLGALIGLHKSMLQQQGRVRVVNPTPKVLQILELTRLHEIFEITQTGA